MQDLEKNPQLAAMALISAAPTDDLIRFVGIAISRYFHRLIKANEKKLVAYGFRPVVSPMAAQTALERVQRIEYSQAWLHALIANDFEAARLALRAVEFYAKRFATAKFEQVLSEVGDAATQIKAAAQIINLTLDITLSCVQKNP